MLHYHTDMTKIVFMYRVARNYTMKHLQTIEADAETIDFSWMSSADDGDDFYRIIGKFAFDPEIRKSFGEAMSDSPHHEWVIVTADHVVIGFACLIMKPTKRDVSATLTYAWIDPRYRGQKYATRTLYEHLFQHRLDRAKERGATVVRGVSNGTNEAIFIAHGFQIEKTVGQWTHFIKAL